MTITDQTKIGVGSVPSLDDVNLLTETGVIKSSHGSNQPAGSKLDVQSKVASDLATLGTSWLPDLRLMHPELLAYAVLEPGSAEPRLRLGFSTRVADQEGDLELTGDVAREVLRWLRLNATFLSTGGGFGSTGLTVQQARDSEARSTGWRAHGSIGEARGHRSVPQPEAAGRFSARE